MSTISSIIRARAEKRIDELFGPKLVEALEQRHTGKGLRFCGCSYCTLKWALTRQMMRVGRYASMEFYEKSRRIPMSRLDNEYFDYELWAHIKRSRKEFRVKIRKQLEEERRKIL